MSKAASLLEERETKAEQWAMAYAHYAFVTPAQIEQFRRKCQDEYGQSVRGYRMEKQLVLTPLNKYPNVPPQDVLDKLREAKERNIFDTFEIAHIEWQEVIPDPILFGRVKECPDYFLIAQWGEDVKFEDINK